MCWKWGSFGSFFLKIDFKFKAQAQTWTCVGLPTRHSSLQVWQGQVEQLEPLHVTKGFGRTNPYTHSLLDA